MSLAKVLRLEEYRDRRADRMRVTDALHAADPQRREVLRHLVEIAELTSSDRSAVVWVDEYGPGLIHPHLVLDQLSDRPRRTFSPEPLRDAWDLGVPSALDRPAGSGSEAPTTFAVSLGSDGTRAWFLVAESLSSRPALAPEVRDRLMFVAGECSALLLHRDLDQGSVEEVDGAADGRFAGWPILKDLEGRESNDTESRRIAGRFVIGRLARLLVDDDLTAAPERIAEWVLRARAELASHVAPDRSEAEIWERSLDALERSDFGALAKSLVDLGDAADAAGHLSGAHELYVCANRIAAALGLPETSVNAARLAGRLLRRQAEWDASRRWYGAAHEVATAAGLGGAAARTLIGMANIDKERGKLPAARNALLDALVVAQSAGDRDAVAAVHQGLLGVDQASGNVVRGLGHGWVAVATFEDEVGRTRCLASLAGALAEYGDRAAAEDAWTIVARTSTETYFRIYAHDALAYLAALRRDEEAFEAHARACDELGWDTGPRSAKAEILQYRGLSYRALGELELAREWLSRALAFAEKHQFNRVLFESERALDELERSPEQRGTPGPVAPIEVREGLRAMRQGLVGAEV